MPREDDADGLVAGVLRLEVAGAVHEIGDRVLPAALADHGVDSFCAIGDTAYPADTAEQRSVIADLATRRGLAAVPKIRFTYGLPMIVRDGGVHPV